MRIVPSPQKMLSSSVSTSEPKWARSRSKSSTCLEASSASPGRKISAKPLFQKRSSSRGHEVGVALTANRRRALGGEPRRVHDAVVTLASEMAREPLERAPVPLDVSAARPVARLAGDAELHRFGRRRSLASSCWGRPATRGTARSSSSSGARGRRVGRLQEGVCARHEAPLVDQAHDGQEAELLPRAPAPSTPGSDAEPVVIDDLAPTSGTFARGVAHAAPPAPPPDPGPATWRNASRLDARRDRCCAPRLRASARERRHHALRARDPESSCDERSDASSSTARGGSSGRPWRRRSRRVAAPGVRARERCHAFRSERDPTLRERRRRRSAPSPSLRCSPEPGQGSDDDEDDTEQRFQHRAPRVDRKRAADKPLHRAHRLETASGRRRRALRTAARSAVSRRVDVRRRLFGGGSPRGRA